jgi:hypothetical protein
MPIEKNLKERYEDIEYSDSDEGDKKCYVCSVDFSGQNIKVGNISITVHSNEDFLIHQPLKGKVTSEEIEIARAWIVFALGGTRYQNLCQVAITAMKLDLFPSFLTAVWQGAFNVQQLFELSIRFENIQVTHYLMNMFDLDLERGRKLASKHNRKKFAEVILEEMKAEMKDINLNDLPSLDYPCPYNEKMLRPVQKKAKQFVLNQLAQAGKMTEFKKKMEDYEPRQIWKAIKVAAASGRLEILAIGKNFINRLDLFELACKGGSIKVITWILSNFEFSSEDKLAMTAFCKLSPSPRVREIALKLVSGN